MPVKYTNDAVRKIVENDTNHAYSLIHIDKRGTLNIKTGKRNKRKMKIKHNACGHTYQVDIYEFIEGKRRCGKCKGKRLRKHFAQTVDSVREETHSLTNGEYTFMDDYFINAKHKHRFKHNTCGTVFEKKWEKFKTGQRCTRCFQKGMESGASRYVRDILDHLHISYETEKRFKACINPKTGKALPFDYYLPDINTLIEIDGEQHERGSFNKYDSEGTMKRDRIKNRYAEEKGIKLVRIPAKKWSQLPKILHAIIAKELMPALTLNEIKTIPQSSHPERINKDLQKVHRGEYSLHDPYYFGIDREHRFMHHGCGHIFTSTLFKIMDAKTPCPHCRPNVREKQKHDTANAKLLEKRKGRYRLHPGKIGVDKKGRRVVICNRCQTSWKVTTGNLLGNKANCPTCNWQKKHKRWKANLKRFLTATFFGKKLTKSQKHWIWYNRNQWKLGKLDPAKTAYLKRAGIAL